MTNLELSRVALKAAYRLRKKRRRSKDEPLSTFDIAVESRLQLQFLETPSLEGMYCDDKKAILISCLRPIGRRAYTCGHEIGHWIFGHGTCVDELPSDDQARKEIERSPEERLANAFSSFLLMPPLGVEFAVKSRGWSFGKLTPEQAYVLSTFFGVGYATLLSHLRYALEQITQPHYESLRKVSPKNIRGELTNGFECPNLVVVDRGWGGRPVDIEVGDALSIPTSTTVSGLPVSDVGPGALPEHRIALAEGYGVGVLTSEPGSAERRLRVSERNWAGLAEYRYNH